ncbi:T9SS type A sorting domain-containing protein [Salibacter halophilus]|nr:T9SS type A sorting domain-containing protein [Salibacter halophilus]
MDTAKINVVNNSGQGVLVSWRTIENNLNSNWDLQFCDYTTCYTNNFQPLIEDGDTATLPDGYNGSWYLGVDIGDLDGAFSVWKIEVNFIDFGVYDTLTWTTEDLTSSKSLSLNSRNVSIYPNPANDQLNLVFDDASISEGMNYDLYSIVGRSVKNGVVNRTKTIIETSNLQSGVYILQVNSESGESVLHEKIVVE